VERGERIAFLSGAAGERALVARLQAGDVLAFRECYETHGPALLCILRRYLRKQSLAEDVLHDTFVAAFAKVGEFRGGSRLATWLTAIAIRRAIVVLREESRLVRSEAPTAAVQPSPEPWLVERDSTRRVLTLLDEMDPPKRLALLLQAHGWTAAEIAEMTGEPRGTILARLSRGRAELLERAATVGLLGLVERHDKGGAR